VGRCLFEDRTRSGEGPGQTDLVELRHRLGPRSRYLAAASRCAAAVAATAIEAAGFTAHHHAPTTSRRGDGGAASSQPGAGAGPGDGHVGIVAGGWLHGALTRYLADRTVDRPVYY
jgi:hypothetical protein